MGSDAACKQRRPECQCFCRPSCTTRPLVLHHGEGRGSEESSLLYHSSHAQRSLPPRGSAPPAGTEHFAPVGRPPSTMLRASPGSVAFFPQQRQIPSVASSFSHPFSLRGDFHLQGCSQSHLKAPKLHKEEPYSPKVKPTEPFSSQDPVPPTPCGLSLFFLLNNDKRH